MIQEKRACSQKRQPDSTDALVPGSLVSLVNRSTGKIVGPGGKIGWWLVASCPGLAVGAYNRPPADGIRLLLGFGSPMVIRPTRQRTGPRCLHAASPGLSLYVCT